MSITAITELPVSGRRLVVRADLNVPFEAGRVTDATRITRFAAGMRPLLDGGAGLVVLSHFGRPKGVEMAFSLRHLRDELSRALGRPVRFATLDEAVAEAGDLRPGQVLLVENIRFEPGEESNDPALAARLARLGDIFVNDAFSCAHRAHASTAGIARLMPAAAGPLMCEEIAALTRTLEMPKRPSVAIVGGGMANTFLFAEGAPMGRSLHEADQIGTVDEIRALAERHGWTLHLPADVVVAREFRAGAESAVGPADACPGDAMILDAGPHAVERFARGWKGRGPSCGTGRWAPSRSRPLTGPRWRWRKSRAT
ncbi:phosphoglycerate kinase [Paracoccaceae bacterium]